jgi:hypothetical protein
MLVVLAGSMRPGMGSRSYFLHARHNPLHHVERRLQPVI